MALKPSEVRKLVENSKSKPSWLSGSSSSSSKSSSSSSKSSSKTTSSVPKPPSSPSTSQQEHQDYINRSGNTYGGVSGYAASQQKRYEQALASGDRDLANRLIDDSKRVGYTLTNNQTKREDIPVPQPTTIPKPPSAPVSSSGGGSSNPGSFTPPSPTQQIPTPNPSIPVMDKAAIEKYAQDQINARLQQMQQAYNQAKQQAETDATQQSQRLADQLAEVIQRLTSGAESAKSEIRAGLEQALSGARTGADQAIEGITTGYQRTLQDLTQNRNIEDVQNQRRLSPFSGRSDYALGMLNMERGRTDREMLSDYNTRVGDVNEQLANYIASMNQEAQNRLGNISQQLSDQSGALTRENQTRLQEIQQNLGNFRKEIDEKYTLAQTLAPQEREALYREIANDERNYELMLRGEYRSDLLANSQLNNDVFNRALESYNTNRRTYEDDRNFDRGVFEADRNFDQARYEFDQNFGLQEGQLTGNYRGTPTLAAQQLGLQNQQANWGAYMDMVNQTGNLGAGPQSNWGNLVTNANSGAQTLPAQQWQQEYDYRAQQDAINNSQQWNQINNAQNNANRALNNENWNRLMEVWRGTGVAPEGIPGVTPGTPYGGGASGGGGGQGGTATSVSPNEFNTYINLLQEKYMQTDAMGRKTLPNVSRYSLGQEIIGLGLGDADTERMLRYFGLPTEPGSYMGGGR